MKNKYRSNLYKAKGLGAAGHGSHHWWHQRLTAAFLVILAFWLVCFCYQIAGQDTSEVVAIIQKPFNVVMLSVFGIIMFYHAFLGMQVVVEDYITCRKTRLFLLFVMQIFVVITIVSLLVAALYVMTL